MKNPITALVMALVLACVAYTANAAETNPFDPSARYPFKTAVVKSKMQGSTTGEQTIYAKGNKKADYTKGSTKVWGMKSEENKIVITLPDEIITVDLKEKTGAKTGNPAKYMFDEYKKLTKQEQENVLKNAEKLGSSLALQLTGQQPSERRFGKFMGKDVEIITIMGLTSYIWKDTNIALQSKGSLMGVKVDIQAYSIETDVAVDDKVFQAPEGINVVFNQRGDAMMRDMAKTMIDDLKDPNGGQHTGSKMMMTGMQNGMEEDQEQEDYAIPTAQRTSASAVPTARAARPVSDSDSAIPVARRVQPAQKKSSGIGSVFGNLF